MLRLLLPLLGNRWRGSDSPGSDVIFIKADALAEMRGAGTARDDTLYIVFSDEPSPPAGAFATVQRPLNSTRLVELLHAAQAELQKRSGVLGNTTITASDGDNSGAEADADRHSISTSMRTAIRWALKANARPLAVQNDKGKRILTLLPGVGYTSALRSSELADLIRADRQVEVIELNEKEKNALHQRRTFVPLRKLEWIYWLTGSDGQIRPELKVSRRYQLPKYPDFAVLPHYRADVLMASLLRAEPLTVGDLAQRAGVRLETACNFVNACWAIGYLTRSAVAVAPAAPESTKKESAVENDHRLAGSLMAPLRKLGLFPRA